MSKPKRARVSAAEVTVVDVVPHTAEELAEADAEVEAALVGETLSAPPVLAKGARVLYTNRLGVAPPKLSEEARAARAPRAPEELVGALQDRIHPTSGRLLAAKPIATDRGPARSATP